MFFKKIHKRIRIILLLVIVGFFAIIIKVFYIQVIEYKKLNNLASNLWSRNLPIEADRGRIYDASGTLLADNLTTTSLVLIPNQIKEKDLVANNLAEILNVDVKEMLTHVSKKTSIERVHPEGRRLNYETADKIATLNYDGVYLVKESKRYYPYDSMLSHVLGYVGIDNQGLSGLELQYDEYLTGAGGAIKYYSDAKGQRLNLSEVYEQPQNGIDVGLTISYELQASIERELDNTVLKYNPDNALVIAMNPNTGEILAMASRPTFDPNNYQDYTIEEINRNLPIWATYEPGSTFKIITLATSLEEKTVDLNKDTFYDSGSIKVEGGRISCWKAGGHGHQTFLQVVENSCNPGFVELGNRLGKEILFDYIKNFGFGSKTGVDLNGEASGILFTLNRVGPLELATTAFGQGVSVTPIQQVTAVSAAINGGTLYRPFIVKNMMEPTTGEIIKSNEPQVVRQVISNETSSQVREALESVVSNGTGRSAYIDSYRVGGKTGTAQKLQNGVYLVNNYIVSFIGFLPADNPQIVVYVAVDNPKGVTQYGGTVAAPIAKNILTDAISILNIEPSEGGTEKKYQWYDKKYTTIPDIVNMDLTEAKKLLSNLNVSYSGSGTKVIAVSPIAGTRVYEQSTIRVYLG